MGFGSMRLTDQDHGGLPLEALKRRNIVVVHLIRRHHDDVVLVASVQKVRKAVPAAVVATRGGSAAQLHSGSPSSLDVIVDDARSAAA